MKNVCISISHIFYIYFTFNDSMSQIKIWYIDMQDYTYNIIKKKKNNYKSKKKNYLIQTPRKVSLEIICCNNNIW